MEENLTLTKRDEANQLDLDIKYHINEACTNIVKSALLLKKMRDTKMYLDLGYETFGDYTQESLNIKERQAYTYISSYESLGERFLQSNANLGITKLSLLAGIPSVDREDVVEANDIAGMTVEEVKALVAENSSKGEQISLLDEKVAELEAELQAANSKPTEVAVREPSAEEIEKIKKAAEDKAVKAAKKEFKAAQDKADAEHKKEIERLKADTKSQIEKAVADYKAQLTDIDSEKAAAITRAEALEKQLTVSSSAETVKFKFYFEDIQKNAVKIQEALKEIKEKAPEAFEKFKGAFLKYLDVIKNSIEGI